MQRPMPSFVRWGSPVLAVWAAGLISACDGASPDVDATGADPRPDIGSDVPETPGDTAAGDLPGDVPADPGSGDAPDDVATPWDPIDLHHAGVTVRSDEGRVILGSGGVRVVADRATGRFRVERARSPGDDASWFVVVDSAESRVRFKECPADAAAWDAPACDEVETTTGASGTRTVEAVVFADVLGEGVSLAVRHVPDGVGPVLVTTFHLRGGTGFVTADVIAAWPAPASGKPASRRRLLDLSVLAADASSGGALFLGPDPATHRLLDNGHDIFFDYESLVEPVGNGASILFPPGAAANWVAAVADPPSGASLVAGFLANRKGAGVVVVDWVPAFAPSVDDAYGEPRGGMTRFEGRCHYLEGRGAARLDDEALAAAGLEGGVGLRSEPFYLEPFPTTGQEGLEAFARRYAARIGKRVWTDVPASWNSWGGGGGSGGYGTNIDETRILENLDLAAEQFLPHGMKWFMIDDGWEVVEGDWEPRKDRFPDHEVDGVAMDGMAWMAAQIRDRGMIPGIWIAPFTVHPDSETAKAHPSWLADLTPLGHIFVPADMRPLDLSNPEVKTWLADVFRKLTHEWGYRWIKQDFAYYAMFTTNLWDPDVTPTEAYVDTLAMLREVIGPDVFYLLVSAVGLTFDSADGNRITLDNEPWWGDPVKSGDQGFKVTVATVAHRYWMSHGLWVNHPDLLFFRDPFGLSMNEARCFASLVALTGGIVKLGESFVAMDAHPGWREVVIRMLPVHPGTARPLDLFEREYPERWLLEASREDRAWNVLGLFHWGRNRDIGGAWDFPEPDDEQSRTFDMDLWALDVGDGGDVLALDAWDGTWEWIADGRIAVELAPRTERILVLHPRPDRPAVAGTSLHLLGGAVEVSGEAWDGAAGRLRADLATVAGQATTVWVMDGDRTPVSARAVGWDGVEPLDLAWEARDGMVVVSFSARDDRTRVEVGFAESSPRDVPACPEWAGEPGSLTAKAAALDTRVAGKLLDDGLIRTVREDDEGNVVAREHLPSSGLWTAIYLASQAYRWAATRDPEALENARVAVEGLHHLTAVTGVPGLYGRAYQRPGFAYTYDAAGRSHWVASTAPGYEGWYFNDDVSKDTMDGILFGYATALDLLEDPDIRARVTADVLAFARHLVVNGLQIIDHTGVVTEHGRLFYSALDDAAGFNAILALSWLRTAVDAFEALPVAERTAWDGPDLRHFYDACLLRLEDPSGCPEIDIADMGSYLDVAATMLNLYVGSCKTSYDNIDMVFQAIHPLLRRERRPEVRQRLLDLLHVGIWEPDRPVAPPLHRSTHSLYTFLYGELTWPDAAPTFEAAWDDAVCTLHRMPLDRRDPGAEETGTEAVCTNRMGRGNAADVIPLELRDYDNYLWRLDPYEIPTPRAPIAGQVHSPEDFLLAYWVGRQAGFLTADQ